MSWMAWDGPKNITFTPPSKPCHMTMSVWSDAIQGFGGANQARGVDVVGRAGGAGAAALDAAGKWPDALHIACFATATEGSCSARRFHTHKNSTLPPHSGHHLQPFQGPAPRPLQPHRSKSRHPRRGRPLARTGAAGPRACRQQQRGGPTRLSAAAGLGRAGWRRGKQGARQPGAARGADGCSDHAALAGGGAAAPGVGRLTPGNVHCTFPMMQQKDAPRLYGCEAMARPGSHSTPLAAAPALPPFRPTQSLRARER
jgi:hypothetical protein